MILEVRIEVTFGEDVNSGRTQGLELVILLVIYRSEREYSFCKKKLLRILFIHI